jgi:hypothetical protein
MRVRHKASSSVYRAELSTDTAYHRLAKIAGQQPILMIYRTDLGEAPIPTWPAFAEDLYVVVRATPEELESLRSAGYNLTDRR